MTWNDNLVCCLTDKLKRGWQNQQHQLVLQHQIARFSCTHTASKVACTSLMGSIPDFFGFLPEISAKLICTMAVGSR